MKVDTGSATTYQITGDEHYIRAKINNTEGQMAWTQTVMGY